MIISQFYSDRQRLSVLERVNEEWNKYLNTLGETINGLIVIIIDETFNNRNTPESRMD